MTPHATAILMLAANIPDIDVVTWAWGSLTYLNLHRHLTHSLLMAPVMALLPLLIVRFLARRPIAWKSGYAVSMVGVASHLLYDLTNVYGVRLLLPFSARWLRWDITSVIDPWIWAALLLSVIAPALSRLIGSEIGEKTRPGRTAAALALGFVLLYDGAREILHSRAIETLDSRVYSGAPPVRVAAFPSAVNPFAWQGVVEGANSYTLIRVNLLGPFDPESGRTVYFPSPKPAMEYARKTKEFRDLLAFSQFPIWSVDPVAAPENGLRVRLSDMRFGGGAGAGFTATAIFDAQMRVVRSWFQLM